MKRDEPISININETKEVFKLIQVKCNPHVFQSFYHLSKLNVPISVLIHKLKGLFVWAEFLFNSLVNVWNYLANIITDFIWLLDINEFLGELEVIGVIQTRLFDSWKLDEHIVNVEELLVAEKVVRLSSLKNNFFCWVHDELDEVFGKSDDMLVN